MNTTRLFIFRTNFSQLTISTIGLNYEYLVYYDNGFQILMANSYINPKNPFFLEA